MRLTIEASLSRKPSRFMPVSKWSAAGRASLRETQSVSHSSSIGSEVRHGISRCWA